MKHTYPHSDGQHGVTLLELLIGLAIGLVISLGLLMLVAGTSQAFKNQDQFARLQENGTSALRYLVNDIRMAGFYGLASSSQSVSLDNATLHDAGIRDIANDCARGTPSPPWSLNLLQPINVVSGLTPTNVHATLPCIEASDFSPTNDSAIILRGATGTSLTSLDANTIYVQSSPTQVPNTIVFKGSAFAGLKAAGLTRFRPDGSDLPIFEYQSHVYFVRSCSLPTPPATTCSRGLDDDGGHSIPTLARYELVGPTLQLVPLVEGIERIHLLFGLDTNNDGVVDRFTPRQPSDWSQVVAMRVTVLVRTTSIATGYSDAGKSYDLGGGATFNCSLNNAPCNYRRHVFSQIALVRNCAERRGGNGQC